jgi:hypothetical protein
MDMAPSLVNLIALLSKFYNSSTLILIQNQPIIIDFCESGIAEEENISYRYIQLNRSFGKQEIVRAADIIH